MLRPHPVIALVAALPLMATLEAAPRLSLPTLPPLVASDTTEAFPLVQSAIDAAAAVDPGIVIVPDTDQAYTLRRYRAPARVDPHMIWPSPVPAQPGRQLRPDSSRAGFSGWSGPPVRALPLAPRRRSTPWIDHVLRRPPASNWPALRFWRPDQSRGGS
ncbi:MAG: hypothetical protein AAF970_03460 [Bacteroidota bacterium]